VLYTESTSGTIWRLVSDPYRIGLPDPRRARHRRPSRPWGACLRVPAADRCAVDGSLATSHLSPKIDAESPAPRRHAARIGRRRHGLFFDFDDVAALLLRPIRT